MYVGIVVIHKILVIQMIQASSYIPIPWSNFMTVRYKVSDIKELPKIELLEGYTVRYATITKNGQLSLVDLNGWVHTHTTGKRHDGHSIEEFFKDVIIPKADGVVFAEFNHKIVGSMLAEINRNRLFDYKGITEKDALLRHAVVLEEHRRNGLYKAMSILALKYCIKNKVQYIYSTPNDFLNPFWHRIFPNAEDEW